VMDERDAQGDVTVLQGDAGARAWLGGSAYGGFVWVGSQNCGAYECGTLSWNPTWPLWRTLTS
jgi:hypothetical protein